MSKKTIILLSGAGFSGLLCLISIKLASTVERGWILLVIISLIVFVAFIAAAANNER